MIDQSRSINGNTTESGDRPEHLGQGQIGISLVCIAIGFVCIWSLSDAQVNPAGRLAIWAVALSSVVIVLVSVSRGRDYAWLHPLSLPFGMLAAMSLGAPLWVYITHSPVGLIYDTGHETASTSALAVAVSLTACEALTLVLAGYLAGSCLALTLTASPQRSVLSQRPSTFRYGDMRRTGLLLMIAAAVSQIAIAALTRGTAYGVNQFQYGWPSILDPAAATLLLAGLALTTIAPSQTKRPKRLPELLSRSEWLTLFIYVSSVVLRGGRGELIAPAVYLAWIYNTQVHFIRFRWIGIGILLTIIAGSAISNWRDTNSLWPGTPSVVVQNALSAVNSSAWITQETILHVPSSQGYLHGSTYLAAVEGQIPGPLSRAAGVPARTASTRFREIIGFSNPNQGFAESYPSEAYLNFGLIGCLGAGVLFGALMGWSWRKCRTTAIRPLDLLYPILLAGLISGFRSDALTQIKDVLYPMLVLSIVMRSYRQPLTTNDDPAARS